MQRLRAIEDDQEAAVGAQAAALQIGQQALTHGGILRRAIPQAERVFLPVGGDAERHDEAVLADVDAVDEQRHQVEAVERRSICQAASCARSSRRSGDSRALLLVPRLTHRRRHGLQAARILPRGHADEHLLDDATIQRIGVGQRLERRQRHFVAVGPDARPPHRAPCGRPSTTSLGTVPAREAVRSA